MLERINNRSLLLYFTLHSISIGRLDDTLQDLLQEGPEDHVSEGDASVGGAVTREYVWIAQGGDVKQGDAQTYIQYHLPGKGWRKIVMLTLTLQPNH